MTCRECEEIVATTARMPAAAPGEEAVAHLTACPACRAFESAMGFVASALDRWTPPARGDVSAAARASLVARLAAGSTAERRPAESWRTRMMRLARHPALLGVLGAGAAAAGAAVSPGWAQQVIAGWAAGAAVLTSLVLLYHGRPAMLEGDYR